MPGCSVPYCHRRADKGYRMFVFPKIPERRKLWTRLCNREDKPPPVHTRMCEYHFDINQFQKDSNGRRGKLKPDAIPTIFDAPLSVMTVYVARKSKKRDRPSKKKCVQVNRLIGISKDKITNHTSVDVKPEFVDVSQHHDNSFWRNDYNVDRLYGEGNVDIKQKGSECEGTICQYSSVSVEQLCTEAAIEEDTLKSTIGSGDILLPENNNEQNIIDRTKDLEEQLREKDEKLVRAQRLLSKSLKQVEKLKALNEKFQKISELSGKSNSKSYSSLRKKGSQQDFLNEAEMLSKFNTQYQ